jgi:flagellar basal-body rod protein FlgF
MSLTQAMYAASAGAFKNQQKLDVLANNLANINTPGFKQDKLIFRVPEASEGEGDSYTDHLQGPSAAMARDAWTDFSQGVLKHSGNPLDVALDGMGFFCIQTPGGTHYTRNGRFTVNEDGVLATMGGHPVLGEGGEIRIDGTDISVDDEGKISVDGGEVGALKIVTVTQPGSLKKNGQYPFCFRWVG